MVETPYPKLLLLLLIHFPFSTSNIPLNSVLHASGSNQSWPSPSSTFSVSFLPSPSSPGSFLAAVTFAGDVPIWSAGSVDSRGSLRLLPSGSLRLTNGSGTTVWDSRTDRLGVTSASIENSGNLLLLNNQSITVWSSFDNPTDTIIQLQNFTTGKVLRSGSYSFQLERSGNLTLRWNNSRIYWNRGLNSTFSSNLSSPSLILQANGLVSIFDSTLSGRADTVYSNDYGESNNTFRFLKLDDDGNLKIYSSTTRNSGPMVARWSALDQCLVYGYCGDYGICSYNGTNPICLCPSRNFDFVDVNDRRKGCKRKTELSDCSGNTTMLTLDHTRLIANADEPNSQVFFAGSSPCRSNCLLSGICLASVSMSDGSGNCWQKQAGSFFTGYQSPSVLSTSYVKVCSPVEPNPPLVATKGDSNSSKIHLWIVAVAVVAGLLGLVAVEVGLWWFCCRKNPRFGTLSSHYTLLEYASGAPVQFTYKELQRCTKNFKEMLGAGGFGTVYRGVLTNRTVVAVKQLEGIEQGEKQFRMEVAAISSTHHLNLVRLIGFCSQGRHRLLVYEFMRNGSLDNFLFTTDSGKLLTWEYRFNIALGTAKGITYLHEECRDCIVHCDIKPENILVDDNYTAKVSDFGLAKLLNPKDNRYKNISSVRGTRGYLAPEWLANLPITSKSDVYSFGMVLLELVSGQRNFDVSGKTNHKKFSIWAYEEFEKGNTEAILDERLSADQTVDMEQVKRMVQTSFWCIQEQPLQRPTMGKVVQMLEGITEMKKPPGPKTLSELSCSGNSVVASSQTRSSSSSATRSFQTMGIASSAPASTRMSEGSLLGS